MRLDLKYSFLLCFIFLLNFFILCQTATERLDTVFCDCTQAITLKIGLTQKIGPTIAPPGFGNVEEKAITRLKTKYAFEKEHHSAWYKLVIGVSGNLSFDIIPEKPDDDYDFMLFAAGRNNFCDSLEKNKLKPIRANISRDKDELKGKTGLSLNAKYDLVKEGVNDAYTHSIKVTKGEIYYLVLDNVYEHGGGHSIQFFYEEPVQIKGVVKNDEDKPLITHVSVTDSKGMTLAETVTDQQNGAYDINTVFKKNARYTLNYYSDSAFVYSKTVSLKDSSEIKDITTVLPMLRAGRKFSIGTINFFPNSPEYVPAAQPSLQNLLKLMEKNKQLKIAIIGHINCAHDGEQFAVIGEGELSTNRAKKIRDYLVRNKVNTGRIEAIGVGCSGMLFPKAKTAEEEEQNRRVEIKVIEF